MISTGGHGRARRGGPRLRRTGAGLGFVGLLGRTDAAQGHRQRLAVGGVAQRLSVGDQLLAMQVEQVLVEVLLAAAA